MRAAYTFDELHVISDLHLGGGAGFQLFDQTAELKGLIDHLAKKTRQRRIGLVINGDFVDFLAEEPARHFDPHGAVDKLNRIVCDPSFAPVWRALRRFAGTPKRTLLINIGNHDLELALPWVKEHLLTVLSGDDAAARGRISISANGTGILCKVGMARVLCVHGNEVDDWNVGDHETIRRIGRDFNLGRLVKPWIPNAGTQLVIDVMNDLKKTYPFVDLLKPEMQAVIPVLLALKPWVVTQLPRLLPVDARRTWDRFRIAVRLLEGEQQPMTNPDQSLPASSLSLVLPTADASPTPRNRLRDTAKAYANALLDRTEERFQEEQDPLVLVRHDEQEEYLGGLRSAWNLAKGDSVEAVREALEGLKEDRSFAIDDPDETFKALDEFVGAEIDFVIAGHTHLERALPRKNGPGHYFNSGTWARLVRLDSEVLSEPARFREVFEVFKSGSMEALDAESGLVEKRPSFVSVWTEGAQTSGEIRRYNEGGKSKPYTVVPGSRFPKPQKSQ
jgi:UDP-2,3-diacylglucosamine pyrophosphatase LpxH